MQKILHRLLALALCLVLVCPVAWAADGDDVSISTREELEAFRDAVNAGDSFAGRTVTLTADIDLGGAADADGGSPQWTPIGVDLAHPFAGSFAGGGHTVSGLYIQNEAPGFWGLFGVVGEGGTVQSLTVSGSVRGGQESGQYILELTENRKCAGLLGGVAAVNYGTLEDCVNTCTVSAPDGSGCLLGGVTGINGGTVTNCRNTGNVSCLHSSSAATGGIAGENQGLLTDCRNSGRITSRSYLGGITGKNGYEPIGSGPGAENGFISNCTNDGIVEGIEEDVLIRQYERAYCVGGIAGSMPWAAQDSSVINCMNNGTVSGSISVGGIVGEARAGVMRGCGNTGRVTGTAAVGGISGRSTSKDLIDCFNQGTVQGRKGYGELFPSNGSWQTSITLTDALNEQKKIGGLVGSNFYSLINCYSSGELLLPDEPEKDKSGRPVTQIGLLTAYNGIMRQGTGDSAIILSEGKTENCYYLKTDTINQDHPAIGNESELADPSAGNTQADEAMFASGEVAWRLYQGQLASGTSEGSLLWGQDLHSTTPDGMPSLTSDTSEIVYRVMFVKEGDSEENGVCYYVNPNETLTPPDLPTDTENETHKWAEQPEDDAFTASTPVLGDMVLQVQTEEKFGVKGGERTLVTTYGTAAELDLSESMEFINQPDRPTQNAFRYSIAPDTALDALSPAIHGDLLQIPANAAAGTYTLSVQATLSGINPVSIPVRVTVKKAVPQVTPPQGKTLDFTGNEQALVIPGSTIGGVLEYSLDGVNYSTALPSATQPGTYRIHYRVTGDNNYEDVPPASVEASIIARTFEITLTAEPAAGGTVSGDGTYDEGAEATVTAAAHAGYRFVQWTENGAPAGTDASLTFTVTADRALTAVFEAVTPETYTVELTAEPTEGGEVTGGGMYEAGASVTVTATANEGYRFVRWTEDGEPVSTAPSLTFPVTADRVLTAVFEATGPQMYTVALTAVPAEGGTVSGGGSYAAGTQVTVTATAGEGFQFACWQENGTAISRDASLTFTVTADRALTAVFETSWPQTYTVTLAAEPAEGGTVSGSGTYNRGETVTVTAAANAGYRFVRWTEDGEPAGTDASLTFPATVDRTLTAVFEAIEPERYTVTLAASPAAGGTVSGGGTYEDGASVTVTAAANEGYRFVRWTEDGESAGTDASLTFTVTADRTLTAVFEAIEPERRTVTLAAEPAEGGTVTGGGAYEDGASVTVTATANEGYRFVQWTENGEPAGTEPSLTFTVTADRTLTAVFEAAGPQMCTVTLTADPARGGTVTGEGSYALGTSVTVTASANEGYRFVCWTENGEPAGTEPSLTFSITADRTLTAVFEKSTPGVEYTVVFNPNGGTVEPQTTTTKDGRLPVLPTPVREGYLFDGWFTRQNGGVPVTLETVFHNSAIIHAHWTKPDDAETPLPARYTIAIASVSNGVLHLSKTEASAGETISVLTLANANHVLDSITAVDRDGKALALTDTGKGVYTFVMPASNVTVSAAFRSVQKVNPPTGVRRGLAAPLRTPPLAKWRRAGR